MIMKVGSNFTISNNKCMEDQIARSFFLFRTRPLPWLAAVVTFVTFATCLGLGFLSIFLTSSALILCPIVFTLSSKPNPPFPNNQILTTHQDQPSSVSITEQCSSEMEEEEEPKEVVSVSDYQCKIPEEAEADNRAITHSKELPESWIGEAYIVSDSLLRISEQQSSDAERTICCEDYEIEWSSRCSTSTNTTGRHDQTCSDGSISDEESLIEIALPTGHYVLPSNKAQEPINSEHSNFQQKWPDCSMESLFRRQSLMELLADQANEEDNLIEIDISMGSIKCPRFEIKASYSQIASSTSSS